MGIFISVPMNMSMSCYILQPAAVASLTRPKCAMHGVIDSPHYIQLKYVHSTDRRPAALIPFDFSPSRRDVGLGSLELMIGAVLSRNVLLCAALCRCQRRCCPDCRLSSTAIPYVVRQLGIVAITSQIDSESSTTVGSVSRMNW